jgi:1-acyl-sn-glycerol-3-phosphate acyltransferase
VFYSLIKIYSRLVIKIYCRKIIINKPGYLKEKGPLLLAANHPNSFLDGIIMTTLFDEGVFSLARGDAFKNKKIGKLLRWLFLLPVYRTSEGIENLSHNYTTFASCQEVFKKNGVVMIFSEGRCINEWHLRPLRKGTARLAIRTWEKGMELKVIPVGFNYSGFRNFGKNVHINFGAPILKEEILKLHPEGKQLLQFNQELNTQLNELVYEIDKDDKQALKQKFDVPQPIIKKILLFIPGTMGFVLHAPLYYLVKMITNIYFDNDHYDSVITGLLMILYPIYLVAIFFIILSYFNWMLAVSVFAILPFTAWAFVQIKKDF